MISTKTRRNVALMLIATAALPFLLFGKEALLSRASPLFWLLGYPVMIAVALAVVLPRDKSRKVTAGTLNENGRTHGQKIKSFEIASDPSYANELDNDFHRSQV